jgi:glycosyltransferase involved in cell wall biosynthesis
MGLQPSIFPIGQVDLETEKSSITQEFRNWLVSCINKASVFHSRKDPCFKLWHLNDGMSSVSYKQILYTFYELDSPTEAELNVVKNNAKVAFSSKFATNKFIESGADNAINIPLGFDSVNFQPIDTPIYPDGRIVFNLLGKLERRKLHLKTIQAWLSKYGNNRKYFLQCALFNPHIPPEELKVHYHEIVKGHHFFNIHFYDFIPDNASYNAHLNSAKIVLGMSGGEGWGLPEFQSVALGKHAVIHNCAGYQDWATPENSVLINPRQKVNAHDGKFFINGSPWNQGNIFAFDDGEFLAGCDEAIRRSEESGTNWAGIKLQHQFTYEKMAKRVVEELKTLV